MVALAVVAGCGSNSERSEQLADLTSKLVVREDLVGVSDFATANSDIYVAFQAATALSSQSTELDRDDLGRRVRARLDKKGFKASIGSSAVPANYVIREALMADHQLGFLSTQDKAVAVAQMTTWLIESATTPTAPSMTNASEWYANLDVLEMLPQDADAQAAFEAWQAANPVTCTVAEVDANGIDYLADLNRISKLDICDRTVVDDKIASLVEALITVHGAASWNAGTCTTLATLAALPLLESQRVLVAEALQTSIDEFTLNDSADVDICAASMAQASQSLDIGFQLPDGVGDVLQLVVDHGSYPQVVQLTDDTVGALVFAYGGTDAQKAALREQYQSGARSTLSPFLMPEPDEHFAQLADNIKEWPLSAYAIASQANADKFCPTDDSRFWATTSAAVDGQADAVLAQLLTMAARCDLASSAESESTASRIDKLRADALAVLGRPGASPGQTWSAISAVCALGTNADRSEAIRVADLVLKQQPNDLVATLQTGNAFYFADVARLKSTCG